MLHDYEHQVILYIHDLCIEPLLQTPTAKHLCSVEYVNLRSGKKYNTTNTNVANKNNM